MLASFFRDKIATIRQSTASSPQHVLSHFDAVTEHEVQSLLMSVPATSCPLDPIPTWLLKKLSPFVVPVICFLCNLSLQSGTFPQCLKEAIVYPRIKKPNMDPEQLKSYRPVSNLSYISKIVERVVAKRLTAHVNASNLRFISRLIARVTVLKQHFCRSTMI